MGGPHLAELGGDLRLSRDGCEILDAAAPGNIGQFKTNGDGGVEQQARRFCLCLRFAQLLPAALDFGQVRLERVGLLRQWFHRAPHRFEDRRGVDGHLPLAALRVQYVERFFQGADSGERIGADQVVVQGGDGQAGNERVNPDSHARQFDGGFVHVDTVDATAGDLAAEKGPSLDLDAGVDQRGPRLLFETPKLGADVAQRFAGEEVVHPGLYAVESSNQEVARAHRDVGYPEVPELLGRRGFVALVQEPFDLREVLVDHGFQGALQEMLDGELGREVGARRLALA